LKDHPPRAGGFAAMGHPHRGRPARSIPLVVALATRASNPGDGDGVTYARVEPGWAKHD